MMGEEKAQTLDGVFNLAAQQLTSWLVSRLVD